MSSYGPEDRELLGSDSARLYEEALSAGGLPFDDARLADGGELRAPFELLVDLGLLQRDAATSRWLAEDPTAVQAGIVGPLSQEGARLLEESSAWARTFAALATTWRRSPRASTGGPFTYLRDEAIGPFLSTLVAECEHEILTAQPQVGRDAATLAAAALRDTAALDRGVRMRTLYQHSARRSAVTHKYVTAVTSRGAEVRTRDEFFNRMIVIDRRTAVIPAGEDLRTAVAVREPAMVGYLVDVFERAWERGRPFTNRDTTMLRGVAAEQRAMTIRMLIEGHSDPVSAKRLGVSPRTYAGYVADLKEEFEADTRFQLGYTMGQRGISGNEPSDPS